MCVHERCFFQTLRNTIDIDEVVENIKQKKIKQQLQKVKQLQILLN